MDVKVGDVVHVRMVVNKVTETYAFCQTCNGRDLAYPKSDVVHVEPRPFVVGDKVSCLNEGGPYHLFAEGTIKAIVDDKAWCVTVNGNDYIAPVDKLAHLNK